ncbi:ATP-binding protein [Geminocystis sp. NIES-3709]|uniref:ATP-binding protein n=1 Tax=Geminocystis sp. NIES-3709 TaxID=1617448 RepID=UPI0005FC4522|nr:ATP-binding protein [Geminocystis sp. NIES-3709]BAQ66562.1 phytochrome [Geminocystis sp. NIES-3709]
MSKSKAEKIVITSENVDLTNCAREQIHTPNSIQCHGTLIVLDKDSFDIIQASKNVEKILGYKYVDLIGFPLATLLNNSSIERIKSCLNKDFASINPLRIKINNETLNLIVHENQGFIFLEFEPVDEKYQNDFLNFYNLTKKIVDEMQISANLQDLSEIIVKNIRELTGFDRVMIYRFDEDGSGNVIAEDKKEELESFFGLRYPPTDVPKPARRLYKLNYIRIISDIDSQGISLPPHPLTNEPFDLSYSTLRSVSPIHIEYLQNMGVQASMSISILHENKLWGLIACHHYQPKYLPYEMRTACEFLGKVMSLNLIAKEDKENFSNKIEIKERLSEVIKKLSQTVNIAESLSENIDLVKGLVNAQGLAICFEGELKLTGTTPEIFAINELVAWLKGNNDKNFFHTDHLSGIYEQGIPIKSVASGIMILYLSRVKDSYIIWFRPEVSQIVTWAGNPHKEAQLEEDGTLTLTPRKSFELWKQNLTGHSLPWLKSEIQQIMEFRNLLIDIIFKKSNELIELNIELQRSNEELDSFAYIASHDLKEPLRGIYNYSYLLLEDYEQVLDEDGSRKLNMLMTLTKRMERLMDALLYYSRLGRKELHLETIDIKQMIEEEIIPILEVSQQESLDIRIVEKIPTFKGDKTLIEEVFMNLITNGLKYNNQPEKIIEIGYLRNSQKSSQIIFYVRDNGIGIEEEHQTIIFNIFKRLHGQKTFGGGTGAGLTIVKKIIERHGGKIWVESTYGQGSIFYFTLEMEEK